jgi:hypothetical protein
MFQRGLIMNRWFALFTVLISTAFCSSAEPLSTEQETLISETDLLQAQSKGIHAFEPGWRFRPRASGGHGTKAIGNLIHGAAADSSITAAEGYGYYKIQLTGGDAKKLSGRLIVDNITVDCTKGRRFRLEWQVRVDSEYGPQGGNASLLLWNRGEKRPVNSFTSKGYVIHRNTWQKEQVEFVCDGKEEASQLEIRLGFWRWVADGRIVEGEVLFRGLKLTQIDDPLIKIGQSAASEVAKNSPPPVAPISIDFTVPQDGEVTLVIEDKEGERICNLIEGVFYKKGKHTFLWDGLDIGENKYKEGGQAYYDVNKKIVKPGTYTVRGLVHDPLKLTYDFTAYPNIGKENVPWPTHLHDGEGGWLADHGMVLAAAFVPATESPYGKDVVALASAVSEAGPAMAYVDMNGEKLGGIWRLGGDWTGADHFARDLGERKNSSVFLYSIKAWVPSKKAPQNSALIKILALTKEGNLEVDYYNLLLPEGKKWNEADLGGFAVHNNLLVFSELTSQKLYVYNTSTVGVGQKGELVRTVPFQDARTLAFSPDGSLLILQDKMIKRFSISDDYSLTEEAALVNDLDDPRQLMVASDGRILVADWGASNQVRIYSPEGNLLKRIGTAGPVKAGPYDKTHMNQPHGMAIDSQNRLWVTERFRLPKRVSVWDLESSKLVRAYYGPTQYGGGGVLDPKDDNRMFYANAFGCMSLKLDRQKGEGVPERIVYLREDFAATGGKQRYLTGKHPLYHKGRRYISNSYSGPTTGSQAVEFWLDAEDTARPATFVGGLRGFKYFMKDQTLLKDYLPIFGEEVPDDSRNARKLQIEQWKTMDKTLVCWVDHSKDGAIQAPEIKFVDLKEREDIGRIITANIGKDFEVLVVHAMGVMCIPSTGFSKEGYPLYDLDNIQHPVKGLDLRSSSGGNQALRAEDGSIIITGGPMQAFKDGKRTWRIHSQWPSLHAGHAAPRRPEYPGQMLSTTRLLGPLVQPGGGEAGEVWGMNSDKGVMYLMTGDGLHLGTLGEMGPGSKQWVMPEAVRGMDVTKINHIPENFYPSIQQTLTGDVVLVSGKTHLSLLNLKGLETVKRFKAADLVVDANVIAQARKYGNDYAAWERSKEGASEIVVGNMTAKLDGKLDEWESSEWVTIAKVTEQHGWGRPVKVPESQAAFAIDDKNLYLAVRSQKNSFISNSSKDPNVFFQTGGGIDFRLATQDGSRREGRNPQPVKGDLRLVVAQHSGETTAFLYRARVPGTKEPIQFQSPVSTITIDHIDDVSGKVLMATGRTSLKSEIDPKKKNIFYTAELSIPLETLGWEPDKLAETRADIGLLYGNEGRTVERSYWHNKGAGIVSDLPSEASFNVSEWGPVELR